jgi:hypothetical protein
MEKQQGPSWGRVVLVVVVVIIGGIFAQGAISASSGAKESAKVAPVVEPAPEPVTAENQKPSSAHYAARLFVEKKLLAPTSAKWPGPEDGTQRFDAELGLWLVSGYVDAQNAYGVPIRVSYEAQLEYIPGVGWKLIALSSDGL